MPIHQAATQIGSLYLGSNPIVAAYKGTELIFSTGLTQNIYLFDTSLMSNESKTITLQRDLRGDTASNPITDWGDGTEDTLLTHTYANDGVYTVTSKYGINSTKDTTDESGANYRSLNLNPALEVSDYSDVVSIEGNSEQVYVKLAGVESGFCISYHTAALNSGIYLNWSYTSKDSNPENSAYGALRYNNGHFHQLGESESFCVYGADCISGIFPIYIINENDSTCETEDGATLTPGVWCRRRIDGDSVRFSDLDLYGISTIAHCPGDVSTREALIKVAGINQRQNTLKNMFYRCTNLKTVDTTEIKNWNLKNITSTERMFMYCSSLEEFDMSNWDISKLTCIKDMFAYSKVSKPTSEEDSENMIIIDIKDYGSDGFDYERLGVSYDLYFKVSEVENITEKHILGSGYVDYYVGNNHYASGLNSLATEPFTPGSFVKTEEVQDGETKSMYVLRANEGTGRTLVIATLTGFYDSSRGHTFSPGIWAYCSTKTNSIHGAIWMAKKIVFEGDLLPKPYILKFDYDKREEYAESWGNLYGYNYKVAEADEIPALNYLKGSGVLTMYNADTGTYTDYEFVNMIEQSTHATSSDKLYYTPTIGNSSNKTYQAVSFMPTGMANWDSRYTSGIWISVRFPNGDGDENTAIYPVKIKLYGDEGQKVYKFNYDESDNRDKYLYCQVDDLGEASKEYYFITYDGLPEHKYLLGTATIKWEENMDGVVTQKQEEVELVRIVNYQGDCPIALYAARTLEYEEELFLIGYDDNSSVYNNNSITHDNVTLDCKGVWAVCHVHESGSYIIPKQLILTEGTVDHSQMPNVDGAVTWTFNRDESDNYDALNRGSYWSYFHIGNSTEVNYKHLRGSGTCTYVKKESSDAAGITYTLNFSADGISCYMDEEGREFFELEDANYTDMFYFTFDSRYPMEGTGCTLVPGGWAVMKNDSYYGSYQYLSSITFNGDGVNKSPYDDTEL